MIWQKVGGKRPLHALVFSITRSKVIYRPLGRYQAGKTKYIWENFNEVRHNGPGGRIPAISIAELIEHRPLTHRAINKLCYYLK